MLLPLPVQNSITETGMARQIRKKSGTGIYHVMLRGINRQDIFEDERDYQQMVSILRGLIQRVDSITGSVLLIILENKICKYRNMLLSFTKTI
jgi:hypothetical protein